MDSDLLRAFVATADAGALSRAARELGVSQPSLSQQIQRLERHLAAPLFRRHGRGVALTDAGEALLPRARRLLNDMRAAEDALRRPAERAVLRVGAIPTIAPYLLPDALRRWRARDASPQMMIHEDYSAGLARQVGDGTLDVAIAALPYAFEPLDIEPLGRDLLVVAVPTHHPAAQAGRISLAELRDAPAVTLDPVHCLGEQVTGFCSSRGVRPSVVCRSAQLATVLELVGAGVGVSIVPAMAAARHPAPSRAYVPLDDHDLSRDIVALWRPGAERSAAAQGFVASVREVLRGW